MRWLTQIFRKEAELPLADLSVIKTDMHSHLIPGIDDGSKDMDETINMLRFFKEMGYKKIITTPHVMSDFYKNTPETILEEMDLVRQELDRLNIDIQFEAAAEYYLDESLPNKIKDRSLLTFGDNYVLFELPFLSQPPNLNSFVFELQINEYKPILAHPERYGFWYKQFEQYRELKSRGVELQLNALSLVGHYGPEVQKVAEQLIEENLITFLGTDCHNEMQLKGIEIARRNKYFHRLLDSGFLKNHKL